MFIILISYKIYKTTPAELKLYFHEMNSELSFAIRTKCKFAFFVQSMFFKTWLKGKTSKFIHEYFQCKSKH